MPNVSEAELAYAAGFLDGEGHICIAYMIADPKRPSKTKYERYQLRVNISQGTPEVLHWFKERFGGSVHISTHKRPYDKTRTYQRCNWVIGTKAASQFISLVRPYLIVKAKEADIALEFSATITKNTGRSALPIEVVAFRKECWSRIRAGRMYERKEAA